VLARLLAGLVAIGLIVTPWEPARAAQTRFEIVEGIPIVDVTIDGRGPFRFAVDSGATWTIVSPELVRKLNLDIVGMRHVSGAGAEQMEAGQLVLDSLNVGGAVVKRTVAYSVELPPRLAHPPGFAQVDGLLGETFFHAFVTTLDYETSMIEFDEVRSFAPPTQAAALPMRLVSGAAVPAVPVQVDGQNTYFELDTGSGSWPVLTRAFADLGINARYPQGSIQSAQGEGGSFSLRAACVRSFGLGGTQFNDVQMYVQPEDLGITAEGDFGGSFGYAILRDFTVSLDFSNRTVYLTRNLVRALPGCTRSLADKGR